MSKDCKLVYLLRDHPIGGFSTLKLISCWEKFELGCFLRLTPDQFFK